MRLKELDVLRAIAILLVLGRHLRPCPRGGWPWPIEEFFAVWNRCGWAGVDLFFVLSGFLISGLLFREYLAYRSISFGRFFMRRGFKIYPAFYTYLLASALMKLLLGRPAEPAVLLSEGFFVQNYGPAIQNHTWSLAVEEHFYLLLPLTLLFLGRTGKAGRDAFRPLVPICLGVGLVLLSLRIHLFYALPFTPKSHIAPTHLRIDSLLFGVLLSYFYHFRREETVAFVRAWSYWLLVASFALISPMLFLDLGKQFFLQTVGLSCLTLGFGGLLMLSLCRRAPAPAFARGIGSFLAAIGFYSYSIYLWHLNVAVFTRSLTDSLLAGRRSCLLEAAIYLPGSILAGVLMAKIVEVPVLALRDRWFPSRSAALDEASVKEADQPAQPREL